MHDIKIQEGKAFDQIWTAINQSNLKVGENGFWVEQRTTNQSLAQRYFQEKSQYKTIDLQRLTEDEDEFLKKSSLSIEYLQLNLKKLIDDFLNIHLQIIAEGCIRLICPQTGQLLTSNRSLFLGSRWCFYRFEGSEVFYLITDCLRFCLYFPIKEVLVSFGKADGRLKLIVNRFKAYTISHLDKIVSYLLCTDEVKIVGVVGLNPTSTAHHIWDDLPALQILYDLGKHHHLDQILIPTEAEYYGAIDEIFSEIASSKIIRLPNLKLGDTILDNNYFGCILRNSRTRHEVVKDSLAKRIIELSKHKCSADFLVQVQEAKEHHFPLLWIGFRLGKRTWIDQVEGISSILKSLLVHFPNLGVVFDGYSLRNISRNLVINSKEENAIAHEKNTLSQIKSLLPETIKVYDVIGRPMYEAIVWACNVDLYMAPFGGGLAKVVSIANKPGIVHTNKYNSNKNALAYSLYRENAARSVCIPETFIVDAPEDRFSKHQEVNRSYDCDWRVVYEEVFKLASSIARS